MFSTNGNRIGFITCRLAGCIGWPSAIRIAVMLASLGLFSSRLAAQTKSTAVGDGLSVTVDWWNVTGASGGYCPVRLQITNTTSRQRPLKVVIESSYTQTGRKEVVQNLELPPSGKADFVVSIPVTNVYEAGTLRIFERSRELKKLRIPGIGGVMWFGDQSVPSVAFIGTASPDLRTLGTALIQITTGQSSAQFGSYAPLTLKPAEAPTKWIDYTMLDIVLISVRDLEQLSAPVRDALISWTMAGGNLFVFGLSEHSLAENGKRI